eukprot:14358730-Alexandrium_andersonii.AAC.1
MQRRAPAVDICRTLSEKKGKQVRSFDPSISPSPEGRIAGDSSRWRVDRLRRLCVGAQAAPRQLSSDPVVSMLRRTAEPG